MKRVLMIAIEFPPINFSGSERPFQFAKYLPDFGFAPLVISQNGFFTHCSNYDAEPLKELKECCEVLHLQPVGLGPRGRRLLGLIDEPIRWVTAYKGFGTKFFRAILRRICRKGEWTLLAVIASLRLLRRPGFDVIWATGPPWQGLQAGHVISRLTGKPFVADIRDPWTYGVLWRPRNRKRAERQKKWEGKVLRRASRIVYTSPLTTKIMQARSEKSISERMVTLTNGFSGQPNDANRNKLGEKCVFSYVGNLTRRHRQPTILLDGLRLACEDRELIEDVRVKFVGGMDGYEKEIREYGLEKIVECIGHVSHGDSIEFMRGSDVLILLQTISGEGRDVIGGKVYEYLAARKPILGIVPKDGGDAWIIRGVRAGMITGIDGPNRVAEGFRHYWRLWKHKKLADAVSQHDISHFNRRNLTGDLAKLFEEVLDA